LQLKIPISPQLVHLLCCHFTVVWCCKFYGLHQWDVPFIPFLKFSYGNKSIPRDPSSFVLLLHNIQNYILYYIIYEKQTLNRCSQAIRKCVDWNTISFCNSMRFHLVVCYNTIIIQLLHSQYKLCQQFILVGNNNNHKSIDLKYKGTWRRWKALGK
jgi:hypothetical protein